LRLHEQSISRVRDICRAVWSVTTSKSDPIRQRIALAQALAATLKSTATSITDVDGVRANLRPTYLSFLTADDRARQLVDALAADRTFNTDDFPPQRSLLCADDVHVASMQSTIRTGEKNKCIRILKRRFEIKDILLGRLRKPASDEVIIFAFHRFAPERPFSKFESQLLGIALEELKVAGARTNLLNPGYDQLAVLTSRQREIVLRLLGRASPKQIADELKISLNTVREYIQDSYRRLAVSNRSELNSRFGLLRVDE